MNSILELENVKNLDNIPKELNQIEISSNINVGHAKEEIVNGASNILDKGGDYIIKAMPVNDYIKDILTDVKNSLKTGDFKHIVKTAVNSSLREGLEFLSMPINVIKDISKVKDILLKGGLKEGLCAGIDIVVNKYLKGNIFGNFIGNFKEKLKGFVHSNSFLEKLDRFLSKVTKRADDFKELCSKWYKEYDKLNIEGIVKISNELKKCKNGVKVDDVCLRENDIIQNMTKFVCAKRDKLSPMQLQMCTTL